MACSQDKLTFDQFSDDKDDKQDLRVLNELENIDDDLDKEGIVLVRLDDDKEAKKYGIDHLPALVYFEEEIPALYEGNLALLAIYATCATYSYRGSASSQFIWRNGNVECLAQFFVAFCR